MVVSHFINPSLDTDRCHPVKMDTYLPTCPSPQPSTRELTVTTAIDTTLCQLLPRDE